MFTEEMLAKEGFLITDNLEEVVTKKEYMDWKGINNGVIPSTQHC